MFLILIFQDIEQFQALLEHPTCDADYVNADIGDGWTVLHAAVALNRVECIKLLLKSSVVNWMATTRVGLHTILHIACSRGRYEVLEALGPFLSKNMKFDKNDK